MASILVFEDRRGSHEVLRSALVLAGHDVEVSSTGSVAGRYDLAVIGSRDAWAVNAARRVSRRVVLCSESAGPVPDGALGSIARNQGPRALLEDVQRFLAS